MAISSVVFGVILFGIANAASDGFVRNFKVVSTNVTYITFSWDMQSGYESTSYIRYFRIYYAIASPGSSSYARTVYIPISSTTQTRNNGGLTFSYTITLTRFNFAQYIIWLRVYRSTTPTYLYSDQILVEIGDATALEINIKLNQEETCQDFVSNTSPSTVGAEVFRAIRIYCQCTYEFTQSVIPGYFDCSAPGYATYRTYIYSTGVTNAPSTLARALNSWLQEMHNNTIIVGRRQYRVEPGPCGLTVPYIKFPFCAANTPATAQSAQSAQSNNVGSSQTTPSDNTAVIVASVFAAMFFILSLGLLAYILANKRPARTMSKPTTGAVGNRTRTNPYLAPTNTAAANRHPTKENIELETCEELYQDVN